ncbi:MAG: DegT/DnrJ/EryC1/StrS family aminotransferase [Spirochaetia bacterium]|nr:DegT/DnrJ/EryC1/StrS family aminotransferase [Spirochaetia bacterium]
MQFIDLKAQQERIRQSLDARIAKVLDHGQYILGPEINELEETLAKYVGVKHCITCSSGTDALLMSLMAYDIKPGDEVITTPFTFIATAEVISFLGAVPVFVDIDEKTYNIDHSKIEEKITSKTKALMPVSLYGQCADMDEINEIGKKHNLPVIEDACQSFGAQYKGRKSCGLSSVGCASFFPAKPLGCYGDGGAIFTDDDLLAEKLKQIRNHGQAVRYQHSMIGLNGRFDTIQAAVLLSKMEIFDEEVRLREEAGKRYTEKLKNKVITPFIKDTNLCVYAQYTVQVENRDGMQKKLNEAGIPSAVHYPIPLNLQPVYQYLNQPKGSFPVAESLAEKVMSLPMHPYLTDEQIDKVASCF